MPDYQYITIQRISIFTTHGSGCNQSAFLRYAKKHFMILFKIQYLSFLLLFLSCASKEPSKPISIELNNNALDSDSMLSTIEEMPSVPPGFDTLYSSGGTQIRDTLLDLLIENADRKFIIPLSISTQIAKHTDSAKRVIHIFVALCDERYQGIAPTPRRIANGQDPESNLYWGAGYGIRNYFGRLSPHWKQVYSAKTPAAYKLQPNSPAILERCIFKHKTLDAYIVADAYDGRCIRETNIDFIRAAAGQQAQNIVYEGTLIKAGGNADMVAYIGHNGLMDFQLDVFDADLNCPSSKNKQPKDVIILACISKDYFKDIMRCANTRPLVWTKSLMGPEAYTIHDAIDGWLLNETETQIFDRAILAIAKYQKISIKAAKTILTMGF